MDIKKEQEAFALKCEQDQKTKCVECEVVLKMRETP